MRLFMLLTVILLSVSSLKAIDTDKVKDFATCFNYLNRVTKNQPAYNQGFCEAHANGYWDVVTNAMDKNIFLWNFVSVVWSTKANGSDYNYIKSSEPLIKFYGLVQLPNWSPSGPEDSSLAGYLLYNSLTQIFLDMDARWSEILEANGVSKFMSYVEQDVMKFASYQQTHNSVAIESRALMIPICAANLFYSKMYAAMKDEDESPQKFSKKWIKGERITSTKFGKILSLAESAEVCSEVGPELINCAVDYVQHQNSEAKGSIEEFLHLCKENLGIRGDISKYQFTSANTANDIPAYSSSTVPTSSAVLVQTTSDAWKVLKEKDENSMESIGAVKTIMNSLKLEWDAVSKANPEAYSDLNRQLVPLFFFAKAEMNNLPLAARLKFKNDLLNNFEIVFGKPEKKKLFGSRLIESRNTAREQIRVMISDF